MNSPESSISKRTFFYKLLEKNTHSGTGFWLHILIMLLIALNVVAVVIESDPRIFTPIQNFLWWLELFSLVIFTIEYLLRVWVSVENKHFGKQGPIKGRIKYMLTPMALIDLMAVLPVWLGTFVYRDWLILRGLRLIRVFKLTRYSRSMDLMFTVLKQERDTILSAFFILGVLIIVAATGMYYVERDIQPEAFGTIPRAIWWATVSLTTVGYGDVVPISIGGKVFGIIIVVSGIGMAALPAGILASGFSTEIRRRREHFKFNVLKMLTDGEIDKYERKKLRKLAHELRISSSDVQAIIKDIKLQNRVVSQSDCPHCSNTLHIEHPVGHLKISKEDSSDVDESHLDEKNHNH